MRLILASSSPSRKQLMAQAGLRFSQQSPDVDESPLPGETAHDLVVRLSVLKAQTVAQGVDPDDPALVVGADQMGALHGRTYGKPHTLDVMRSWLDDFSGNTLIYHSGLAVCDTRTQQTVHCVSSIEVLFRTLSQEEREHFLQHGTSLTCAGGLQLERASAFVTHSITSNDPTAVQGLSLIALYRLCEQLDHNLWLNTHAPQGVI